LGGGELLICHVKAGNATTNARVFIKKLKLEGAMASFVATSLVVTRPSQRQ